MKRFFTSKMMIKVNKTLLRKCNEKDQKIKELVNCLTRTHQNLNELLEWSEVDKEVEHVWSNASLASIAAKKLLKDLNE